MRKANFIHFVTVALVVGCSGVQFEPIDPNMRVWPISRKTMPFQGAQLATLDPPVLRLGKLFVPKGGMGEDEAAKVLASRAWRYGCDATAPVRAEDQGTGAFYAADCYRTARFKWPGDPPAGSAASDVATAPPPDASPVPDPVKSSSKSSAKSPVAKVAVEKAPPPKPVEKASPPKPAAGDETPAAKAAARQAAIDAAATAAADRERKRLEAEEKRQQSAQNQDAARAQKQAEADEKARARKDAELKARDEAKQKADAARQKASDAAAEAKARKQKELDEQAEKAQAAANLKAQERELKAREAADKEAAKKAEAEAEKARKEAAAKAAGEEATAARKAAAKQALEDGHTPALIEFLGKYPNSDDSPPVFAALQRAAVEESPNWLSDDKATPSTEIVERRLAAPATLKADLDETKAVTWRWMLPRNVAVSYTLRNPTAVPVVVELDLPPGRTHRLVGAKATLTVKQVLPCIAGAPEKAVRDGALEYRAACQLANASKLVGIRPAAAEVAIDRRVGDPDAPLEVFAKVWKEYPNSRLITAHLDSITDQLRRRAEQITAVEGKLTLLAKVTPGKQTPVRVQFHNSAGRDVTVLYGVGTGRDERLLLPHNGGQELALQTLVGLTPELHVFGLLPSLRTPQWLVGNWLLNGARLAILPSPSGGWWAFALVVDETGSRRAVFSPFQLVAGVGTAEFQVTTAFADAIGVKSGCTPNCVAKLKLRLSDQDQYVVGGSRFLVTEITVGDKPVPAKWAAEW